MENYDADMEQRVWQRVLGTEQPQEKSLQALAVAELSEAAVHWLLSQQLQGKERAMLRKIFEEDQGHTACLKGIHYFIEDQPLSVRPVVPTPEAPVIALRKSYGRKLNALREYTARASDPEYGHIFQRLAQEEQQHCKTILQIVGQMKKTG
jgi:rubrerythrin